MLQQEQIRVLERARELARAGVTDLSHAGGSIDAAVYTDPQRLEHERAVLFRRLPLLVGFSSQVRDRGDWFTHDHSGMPLLVVRGADGVLRAFLNACRHRGARLVKDADGRGAAMFSCWFHGWTFDTCGALQKVPVEASYDGLDKEANGLRQLQCDERHGLVFVIPTPGVALDIDDWLGPLIAELGTFGIGDYTMTSPVTQTRALNWKLHMDATQEVLHLPYLHAETAGAGYFRNLSLLRHERPHARMVMPAPSAAALRDEDRERWRVLEHAAVVYGLFPNATLLLHMGYVQLLTVFPVDAGTTIMHGAMLAPPGAVDYREIHQRKHHHETYWATMAEDIEVCEQMQANMSCGAIERLQIGRAERLLVDFHRTVEEFLADPSR